MPPKKKEEKSDFSECDRCSTIVLPKDKEKHTAHCQNPPSGFEADYDFVKDNVLFGTMREVLMKDPDLTDLSMGIQKQIIFLHPTTMTACDIAVDSYVSVSTEKGHHSIRTAWPHHTMPLLTAATLIPNKDMPAWSKLKIQPYRGRIPQAECVELTLKSGEITDELLMLEAIRRKYFGTPIKEGSELRCDHYYETFVYAADKITLPEDTAIDEQMSALTMGDQEQYFRITERTKLVLRKPSRDDKVPKTRYEDIGGLSLQKELLQNLSRIPKSTLTKLKSIKKLPPRRILLTGPSGTGKTLLIEAVSSDLGDEIFAVKPSDLESSEKTDIENLIKKTHGQIVLLDDLDKFGSKKDRNSVSNNLSTFLKTLPQETLVLATSSKPLSIEESLRCRFEREIDVNIPTTEERLEILKLKLQDAPHILSDADLGEMSSALHGFTGANIESLIKEAVAASVVRTGDLQINLQDLKQSLKFVKPAEMREVVLEIPKVFWTDIGGMDEVKKRLRQCVEWPLLHKDAFKRLGIRPPRGLLMYGPPGCSKTMIARALATESGLNFLAVKGPELFSKWVGDSERAVRDLFRRARSVSPAVVFFDEIDAIATERQTSSGGSGVGDRVLTQLLTEIDGLESLENVILIAATNRPDIIDQALLRPGRLDSIVYVPLPDRDTRSEILKISLAQRSVHEDVDVETLIERTNGYSGAEIVGLVHEAAMQALEESFDIAGIANRHFVKALEIVKPRISQKSIDFYESFHELFQKR